MTQEDESDQLPESGPGGQSTDDTGGSESRTDATENSGGSDEGDEDAGDATGNPANAG